MNRFVYYIFCKEWKLVARRHFLMNNYRKIDRTKVQFDFFVEYPNKQFYDDEIVSLGGKVYYNSVRLDGKIKSFKRTWPMF